MATCLRHVTRTRTTVGFSVRPLWFRPRHRTPRPVSPFQESLSLLVRATNLHTYVKVVSTSHARRCRNSSAVEKRLILGTNENHILNSPDRCSVAMNYVDILHIASSTLVATLFIRQAARGTLATVPKDIGLLRPIQFMREDYLLAGRTQCIRRCLK